MRMNDDRIETGLDNVLLLAMIASVVLHMAALYSRIDWSSETTARLTPEHDAQSGFEIPIEFIPMRVQRGTESVVASATVQSIIEEANQNDAKIGSTPQAAGHYSFVRRQALLKNYLSEVREEIEKHKYASVWRREALVGNITVRFDILSDGSFRQIAVFGSSGNAVLDQAAVTAVELSNRKVKRPNTTGSRRIATSVVIKYQYGL